MDAGCIEGYDRFMDEVKIHSGTRVKLKRVDEDAVPAGFLTKLREFAHGESGILAIFLFAVEPEGQEVQLSLAVALKSRPFRRQGEEFLRIVEEIQMMLPEDLGINLYRFGSSDQLATFCVTSLEPVYLESASWLAKQRRKH